MSLHTVGISKIGKYKGKNKLSKLLISLPLVQNVPSCTTTGRDCYAEELDIEDCSIDCEGLYADVDHVNSTINNSSRDLDLLNTLVSSYETFKRSQVGNFEVIYDEGENYRNQYQMVPKPFQPLRVVQIFFDTATYDKIVKDVSVTLADQLGVIGGTMGLFAGFSFLSALEIVYFVIKYLISVVNRSSA